jgi:CRP/FNR family transcriptional regulator
MNRQTLWYLKQVDLFEGMNDEDMMKLAGQVIERECIKKELIYTPFEDSDSVCILKKGEVTLYYSHLGKKLIIDVLKPGSLFGNIGFKEGPNTHFAEVTEDAYVCIIKKEDFMKIVQAKPELMMKLIQVMSNQLADYESKLKSGLFDAKEKIVHYLKMSQMKENTSLLNKLFGVRSKVTHERIAQHTGLSRETVTRAIRDLSKEGVLAKKDGMIALATAE